MLIKEEPLRHWIDNFYGYGSWNTGFWFIGYEEGGGDAPEEVCDKLDYFNEARPANAPALSDIREMYSRIAFRIEGPRAEKFANFYDHRFGPKSTLHGTWKNMIAFEYGYQNKKLPDLLAYQRKSFLTMGGNSALIQLYPLPAHNHAWYYAWLDLPELPFLKSRAAYESQVYANRMQVILKKLKEYKPEVVVMYGMENINLLKQSVQEFFPGSKFKSVKAIKLQIPQHHITEIDGTILLITTQIPGLRHNRIETGFDWQKFGMEIRKVRPKK